MTSLEDRLKIWAGRKLSTDQIEKARKGVEDKWRKGKKRFYQEGERLIIFNEEFTSVFTPDASEGYRSLHRGYSLTGQEYMIYDGEGLLVEKIVEQILPFWPSKYKQRSVYNPPGSWFGKKVY